MPRRGTVPRREVLADPLYNSALVTKFINTMMYGGKRATSQHIMYGALSAVQQKSGDDPLKVFKKAVDNVKPALEVKSRRVGGSNYQVPIEVNPQRRTSLALRWLISFSRKRAERGMVQKLANEILDAANNRGGAVKKKEDVHKMAEANKAFAHYRW
ncbi:MAG: 30S ribosomal protein S7 [Vicinamibacteria bacterium]|nr:30S ribosomal protein S7 [Vicinamibacteria bacterium]